MKVSFENGVGTYSGKYDEVVYQSWFKNRLCYARKYAYPELGPIHLRMASVSNNLNKLYLQAEALYIQDLKAYAKKNARENLPRAKKLLHAMPTAKSLFIKCMWQWQASDPTHVELETVTLEDIIALDSPLQTVKKCVEAGYLKRVSIYLTLNHAIGTAP